MRISDWSSDVCSSDLHYNQGDWGSAALLVRHLLEGLATRLLTDTYPEAPLPRQLETLTKGVDLHAPLEDIADMLAPEGGFGKQLPEPTSIGQNAAEQMLERTEQLLSYMVGLPGAMAERSEERRVGKEGVSTCRSRWSPYH